ncbi:MAG TPA: hypothetical protein VHD56_02460 [Tepidisphaeraceae bacterium]|nr:hypothetical protein [Tepidisphaeraceae bacterium]
MEGKQREFNRFDYTAHYLFTQRQLIALNQRSNSQESDQLEAPLSVTARSVSDSIFESGCVDLSRASDRAIDRTDLNAYARSFRGLSATTDRRRDELEVHLFTSLDAIGDDLFYWPVHVDGTPWLCLFTMVKPTEDDVAWSHLYYIYRDLAPSIDALIRQAAIESYYAVLDVILRKHLFNSSDEDRLANTNGACKQLCRYWPFPRLQFRASEPNHTSSLPFRVELETNLFWTPRIAWPSQITQEDVTARLQALHSSVELISLRASTDTYYNVAHILSNLLPSIKIHDVLHDYTALNKSGDRIAKFELKLADERDIESEQFFCDFLTGTASTLASATLIVQLMRVTADGWVLPADRWQTTHSYSLRDVVEEARREAQISTHRELSIDYANQSDLAALDVSNDYLRPEFIRALIFEIFRNVCIHSESDNQGRRCIVTATRCADDRQDIELSISNTLQTQFHGRYEQDENGLWVLPHSTAANAAGRRRRTFLATLIRLSRQGGDSNCQHRPPFEITIPRPVDRYITNLRLREVMFRVIDREVFVKPLRD